MMLYNSDGQKIIGGMHTNALAINAPQKNQFSDFVIVDDHLWLFQASDNNAGIGTIKVFEVDTYGGNLIQIDSKYHQFGHCNSVDYCSATDRLIIAYEDNKQNPVAKDKIYIIENAKNKILNASDTMTFDSVGAVEYDCTASGYGTLLNCAWGPDNIGAYDMAVFISDLTTYRIVQFGRGTVQFANGTYMEGAGENAFNGTFQVVETFTCDNPKKRVNQGACWYGNKLYMGVGHHFDMYWVVTFAEDNKAKVEEVYMPFRGSDGSTPASASTEGIAVTDKYIFIGIASSLGGTVLVKMR